MEAQRFAPRRNRLKPKARRRIWRRRWTKAIRICGGDVRAALRATLVANSFLEGEVERLTRAISRGFARGLIRKPPEQARMRFAGVALDGATTFVERSGWTQQPPSFTPTSMPSMHRLSNCSIRRCAANPLRLAAESYWPHRTRLKHSESAAACRVGGRASFVRN